MWTTTSGASPKQWSTRPLRTSPRKVYRWSRRVILNVQKISEKQKNDNCFSVCILHSASLDWPLKKKKLKKKAGTDDG